MRTLSPVELRRFLAAVADDWLEALFVLAVASGMRQGEILGMLWGDVDFANGVIDIKRSLSERKGVLELKEPKNAASRRGVPIGATALSAFADHRARMVAEGFYGPERVVFCDTIGGPIRKANLLHRHFEPTCHRAGLTCRFHDLRHAHVSNLLEAGVALPAVAARAGHGSPATTAAIYAHAMPTGQGKAVNVSEAIITGEIAPIGSASAAPDETIV
jgi:integrase